MLPTPDLENSMDCIVHGVPKSQTSCSFDLKFFSVGISLLIHFSFLIYLFPSSVSEVICPVSNSHPVAVLTVL